MIYHWAWQEQMVEWKYGGKDNEVSMPTAFSLCLNSKPIPDQQQWGVNWDRVRERIGHNHGWVREDRVSHIWARKDEVIHWKGKEGWVNYDWVGKAWRHSYTKWDGQKDKQEEYFFFWHMNIRAVWRAAVTYSHEVTTIKGAGCWNQTEGHVQLAAAVRGVHRVWLVLGWSHNARAVTARRGTMGSEVHVWYYLGEHGSGLGAAGGG